MLSKLKNQQSLVFHTKKNLTRSADLCHRKCVSGRICFQNKERYSSHSKRSRLLRRALLLPIVITGIIAQTGCGNLFAKSPDPVTRQNYYFDTICSITIYDMKDFSQDNANKALDSAFDLCKTYENMLSKTVDGSDIWNINHAKGKPVEVNAETAGLISKGIDYGKMTDGKFDIMIGKAEDLYDFHSDNPKVPSADAIKEAISHVDYRNIKVDGNTVTISDPEGEIDLGGIAKGYIADRLAENLDKSDVTSAIISLGGNIECVGGKPSGKTQTDFTIGIETPYSNDTKIVGTSPLKDGTMVTSGVYERYFVGPDGKEYHHILDSSTGYPANTDVLGVTIKAAKGKSVDCDALATTCLIYGVDKGKALIESLDGFEAVFIGRDGKITTTSGMDFTAK